MKNHNGDDIRYTDRYRHKYDSAMAEWLDSGPEADQSTGSVEWQGHVAQYGKRLLHSDDRGFVSVERFATEAEAIERFEAIDAEYGGWLDSDEDEVDEADEALHVTMSLEALGRVDSTMKPGGVMNGYRVTLTDQNGDTLQVPFFTGLGWTTDPTIGDVLQCLATDLSVETPEDAEELELGIRAWLELEAQNARVRAFFGDRVDILLQFNADERYAEAATGTAVTL